MGPNTSSSFGDVRVNIIDPFVFGHMAFSVHSHDFFLFVFFTLSHFFAHTLAVNLWQLKPQTFPPAAWQKTHTPLQWFKLHEDLVKPGAKAEPDSEESSPLHSRVLTFIGSASVSKYMF